MCGSIPLHYNERSISVWLDEFVCCLRSECSLNPKISLPLFTILKSTENDVKSVLMFKIAVRIAIYLFSPHLIY